ncbi:hypothetical protein HpMS107_53820 [Helicobacter pylori]
MHVAKKTHAAHSVSTLRTVDRDSVGAQITTAAPTAASNQSPPSTRGRRRSQNRAMDNMYATL